MRGLKDLSSTTWGLGDLEVISSKGSISTIQELGDLEVIGLEGLRVQRGIEVVQRTHKYYLPSLKSPFKIGLG